MSDLEDFLQLKERRSELAKQLEDLADKKEGLEDLKDLYSKFLEDAVSTAAKNCNDAMLRLSLPGHMHQPAGTGSKLMAVLEKSIDDFQKMFSPKSENVLIVGGDCMLICMGAAGVIAQYELYRKSGEIGDFYERAKRGMQKILAMSQRQKVTGDVMKMCCGLDAETVYEIPAAEFCRLVDEYKTAIGTLTNACDIFNSDLEKHKEFCDKLETIAPEEKKIAEKMAALDKKLGKYERQIRKFNDIKEAYSDAALYSKAQQKALAFAGILQISRLDKLVSVCDELDVLTSKYDLLQAGLQNSVGNYASMRKMYDVLSDFGGYTDPQEVMAERKKMLDNSRNDDPEKEVGLFRNKIAKKGVYVDKSEAAAMLAAARRLDEMTAARFQSLWELEGKIYRLKEKRDVLNVRIAKTPT
ncbi:MAG: hypothetical protein NTY99_01105 [DPANN group archaeon]|nr:hypothetical protein [DPANN group archaeon]